MKMTFGRKFFGCVLAVILISLIYFITLAVTPGIITGTTMIIFGVFVITICFAYIGGNIWSNWIKSKYFQPGLLDK